MISDALAASQRLDRTGKGAKRLCALIASAASIAIAAPLLAGALACGCGGGNGSRDAIPRDPQKLPMMSETTLSDTTVALPRLHFGDGQVSLNDRCMVRQVKLNPRLPGIYVNGRPVGFC